VKKTAPVKKMVPVAKVKVSPTGKPNAAPTGKPNAVRTGKPNAVRTGKPNAVPTGKPVAPVVKPKAAPSNVPPKVGPYGVDVSTRLTVATAECLRKTPYSSYVITRGYEGVGAVDPLMCSNLKAAQAAGKHFFFSLIQDVHTHTHTHTLTHTHLRPSRFSC